MCGAQWVLSKHELLLSTSPSADILSITKSCWFFFVNIFLLYFLLFLPTVLMLVETTTFAVAASHLVSLPLFLIPSGPICKSDPVFSSLKLFSGSPLLRSHNLTFLVWQIRTLKELTTLLSCGPSTPPFLGHRWFSMSDYIRLCQVSGPWPMLWNTPPFSFTTLTPLSLGDVSG